MTRRNPGDEAGGKADEETIDQPDGASERPRYLVINNNAAELVPQEPFADYGAAIAASEYLLPLEEDIERQQYLTEHANLKPSWTLRVIKGGRSDEATRFNVTFFIDKFAKKKRNELMTLEELRDLVLRTNTECADVTSKAARDAAKATLPWLKLAAFGKQKMPKS